LAAKWKKQFNPQIILDKFSKIRTLDGDNASFNGWEFDELIPVLKTMIEFGDDITAELGQRLIVCGFHKAAKKEKIDARIVISEINKE
jgi:hypothetical protein